jgi:predicted nucleic acid-binding protein
MGKEKYLVDSNIIIKLATENNLTGDSKSFLTAILNDSFNISIITKIEVLSKDDSLIDFVNVAKVFELDETIVLITIQLRRKYKIRLPDAIIAATAIANKFILLTHNAKDFGNIKSLVVIDPIDKVK